MATKVLTKENWSDEVLTSDKPVLVDFWASWCGPCRMLSPTVEQLSEEYVGKVSFGKVNVDEQQELAVRYNVASIPTLVLFKNGKETNRSIGVRPKAQLEQLLK